MADLNLHDVKSIRILSCERNESTVVGPYTVTRIIVKNSDGYFIVNLFGPAEGIRISVENPKEGEYDITTKG